MNLPVDSATDERPVLRMEEPSGPAAKAVIAAMRAAGNFCIRSRGQTVDLWRKNKSGDFYRVRASALRYWIAGHFRCVQFDYRSKMDVPVNPTATLSGWITMTLEIDYDFPRLPKSGKR
jgi:hypothetical protein